MSNRKLTVVETLHRIFPMSRADSGAPYMSWPVKPRRGEAEALNEYAVPPLLPFDLFAATAHLLEVSGAYHHIWARTQGLENIKQSSSESRPSRRPAARRIDADATRLKACIELGRSWRRELLVETLADLRPQLRLRYTEMKGLRDRWARLFIGFGQIPVFTQLDSEDPAPEWWGIAHELMVIADEAAANVGFLPFTDWDFPDASKSEDEALRRMPWFEFPASVINLEEGAERSRNRGLMTLSGADPDVLCVLPKARTTPVGCTMRSISHHLSLLPAQGVARGRWFHPPPGPVLPDATELNLLLIPYPYEIADDDFSAVASRQDVHKNWGFFEVEQSWLPEPGDAKGVSLIVNHLHNLISDLKTAASTQQGATGIDGIIFPELALTYPIYVDLFERLQQTLPELEFLIAGLSNYQPKDGVLRHGNFVAVTVQEKHASGAPDGMASAMTVREKRHRWKLDHHQIKRYGLTGGLNPRFQWWEDLDLLSRRVDFTAFRGHSLLSAMICEDLARVDPCQELLRAVGPNLIVALLMDGPQLATRWPARYATVLAEDPGCSVLTLTSRGLAARQRRVERAARSRHEREAAEGVASDVIALWRDDYYGHHFEIGCPEDSPAVWLKIWASQAEDASLDGRTNEGGKTWTYGTHAPLKIDNWPNRYGNLTRKRR